MLNVKKLLTEMLTTFGYKSPSSGWTDEYLSYARVKRVGNTVTVIGESKSGGINLPASTWKDIATLHAQFRPSQTVYFPVSPKGGTAIIGGKIDPSTGIISLYSTAATLYWGYSVTYVVD